jgi:hypothetical protein
MLRLMLWATGGLSIKSIAFCLYIFPAQQSLMPQAEH